MVCGEYDMREFIVNSWNGVMDYRFNPLKHIPDLQVRHMMLQVLACMICVAVVYLAQEHDIPRKFFLHGYECSGQIGGGCEKD